MAEGALISAATAAAKAVAQLVSARALDEIKLGWGFKGELEELNQKFEYIQAFLVDVSNNYSKYAQKSSLVSLWVQKVKDAAYLADNVMDEYAVEMTRRKMEINNNFDKFCNFFTPSNHVLFHLGMAHKVNKSWVDGSGLQQLTNLGEFEDELHIAGLEWVKDKAKAKKVGLAVKANVTKLTLVWTEGRGETSGGVLDEDVLEALEPHPNITSLEVHNFLGVRFPPWIMEMINWTRFVNLIEVKLLNCSRCQTLPTLGHLPLLRSLILSGFDVKTIDVEFYGYYDSDLSEKLLPNSRRDIMSAVMQAGGLVPEEVSFRSLLDLDISGFCRLTTWNEPPQAAFPCLETLRIRGCSQLESVPTLSSKTLKFLELVSLNRVKSLDIIKFNCNLTYLILKGLHNLESLPEELSNCTKLQELVVYGAHKLSRMPNGLKSLVNLQGMMVFNCKVINFVMDDLLHVRSSLRSFAICRCPMLIKMPSGLQECTSLWGLSLDDRHLLNEGSPINISKFQLLFYLGITCSSAEHLRSVLGTARGHKVLAYVTIEGFKNEDEMEAYFSDMTPFHHLPSLTYLRLVGHPNIKRLPRQLDYT